MTTQTPERLTPEEGFEQAMQLLDRGLGDIRHRELVSTDEVADLLPDVRQKLMAIEIVPVLEPA